MPITAGQKITAARLNWDMDGTTLTDETAPAGGGYEPWGTEELTFTNPGVAVHVAAILTGRMHNATVTDTFATTKIEISFDGGSTWTEGNAVPTQVGTTVGIRSAVAVQHYRAGTPTGNIVIRPRINVAVTSTDALNGHLMAILIPQ